MNCLRWYMHQKPWSKSCQDRRYREPFVHTSCWMRFSTDCYCPNRWMYHFHGQPELSKTTPNHQTRHRVPTQIWNLPSRSMTCWWPWQRTPRKWRMMKPLQWSKPSATATWKHWRKTQRPVCGYNTSIWYGFSVTSSEPNGLATGISILKLYRRCFRTWPFLATRCMQSPPAFISVRWLTCLMIILEYTSTL